MMKFSTYSACWLVIALACLASHTVAAFIGPSFSTAHAVHHRGRGSGGGYDTRHGIVRDRMAAGEADVKVDDDLSIPYDAAARLAYDEWRAQFNRGPFDPVRFESFKTNYEAVTIANVISKKLAREAGQLSPPQLMTLNEFGDYSEEEYRRELSRTTAPMSTGDVLGKAVEAAQSQSEASSALADAFEALAEDEEKLARELGLESVEELEVALDSLEGIASDGGALESENIAREARVRSAYLDWCKKYEKEPDESRFAAFFSNFMAVEAYSTETGEPMDLNEFADYTTDEYAQMQSGSSAAESVLMSEQEIEQEARRVVEQKERIDALGKAVTALGMAAGTAAGAAAETAAGTARAATEAAKFATEAALSFQRDQELRLAELQRENEKKFAEARRQKELQQKERQMKDEERRKQLEEERAERQKAQEKQLAKLKAEQESAIIAAAKAQAQKDAERAAQQKRFQADATELVRRQAREYEERQRRLAASKTPAAKKKETASFWGDLLSSTKPQAPPPPSPTISVDLTSIFFKEAEQKSDQKKPAARPQGTAKATIAKKSADGASVLKSKPSTPSRPPAPKAPPASTLDPATNTFASWFGSKEAQTSAPKPVQKPAPSPPAPASTLDPATNTFASWFGGKESQTSAPKPVQKPAPSPPAPGFSFFSAPAAKKTAPAPPSVAKSAAAKASSAFSVFSSPSLRVAPLEKAEPKKTPSLSVFSSPSLKVTPPTSKPTEKKVEAKSSSAFSVFSSPSLKVAPATPKKKVELKKQDEPKKTAAFSFFSAPPAPAKEAPAAPAPATLKRSFFGNKDAPVKRPEPASAVDDRPGTFSLFGATTQGAKADTKKPDVKMPDRAGTLTVFGAKKSKPAPSAKPAVVEPTPKPARSFFGDAPAASKPETSQKTTDKPAFSFFGGAGEARTEGPAASTKGDLPVLSRWTQNPDGSITGVVSNSVQFRDGTKITTSPVKGAKAGAVVKTGSGSKYYLA